MRPEGCICNTGPDTEGPARTQGVDVSGKALEVELGHGKSVACGVLRLRSCSNSNAFDHHNGPLRTTKDHTGPPKAYKKDHKLKGITPYALKLREGRSVNPDDAWRSPVALRAWHEGAGPLKPPDA